MTSAADATSAAAAQRTAAAARRRARLAAGVLALAAAVPFAASVRAQVAGFVDVPKDHWAADSIAKLVGMGIVQGGGAAAPFGSEPQAPRKTGPQHFDGDKPVTRYELAVTLYRFVVYIERADKQPKGKLPIKGEPKSGPQAVQTLIAQGYLPKDTPLAVNGSAPVTAQQFANALSEVIVMSRDYATPASPDSDFSGQRPGDGPNSGS